jgi:zinc protease
MIRTTALLLATAILLVNAPAPGADTPAWRVEEHVLSNGLRVVLAPDEALDDVSVVVHYGVGSSDDPAGKDGLAHVVEHLMFAGSRHVGPGEHAKWIARAGGWGLNATTSLDGTDYFVTVPPEQLPLVFWLESDRMGFVSERVDDATLARERDLITYEASDKLFDRGLGTAGAVAMAEVFPPWHPYHREPDPQWVPAMTLADVRAFLRTWYGPANATLIVAGRFDAAAALELAERYFGGLRGMAPPTRPPLPDSWDVHDVLVQMHANVRQAQVIFMWPTPAFGRAGDAELDVAALLLAGPGGRLQAELVGSGLATAVHARQDSGLRASTFHVSATVAARHSVTRVADVIQEVLTDLARDLRPEECARARAEAEQLHLLGLETSMARARRLALTHSPASPWEIGRYSAMACEDVRRALATALVPNRRAVVLAMSDPSAPVSGRVVSRKAWLP